MSIKCRLLRFMIRKILVWMLLSFNICSKERLVALVGKTDGHTDGGTHYYDSDVPVYRYADVLLMLAECENGLGAPDKCAAYINEVRKRAYGDKFEQHKYIAGDYADNEWAICRNVIKSL